MGYSAGDVIIYGNKGVCRIDEIKSMSFAREEPKEYYLISPMFTRSSLVMYVPLDNELQCAEIKPVLSRDEAMALIESLPFNNCDWVEDRNERKEKFATILNSGSREEIAGLIHLINKQRAALTEAGKKLNAQDARALDEAVTRINNELAIALDVEPSDVSDIIRDKTGINLSA